MNRWLLKTEPTTYSFADLVRAKKAVWDGVSNALALQHLRAMKPGDEALIYHSGKEKAAVGIAKVSAAPYADPKEKDPKLVVVDLVPVRALQTPVTLAAIKADPRFAGWELVRMSRLSVMPVSATQWAAVLKLAEG